MARSAPEKAALFRRLFRDEGRWVWLTLRRLGVPEADVEDVAHELFLKVYAHLEDVDTERPMRPWLFAFAFRLASDDRRRASRRTVPLDGVEPPSTAPNAPEVLEAEDRHAALRRALATIPVERRAVLVAHEMDEIPMKDVADALGIPLGTAYSRHRVAREELRDALDRIRKRGELP